MAEKQEETYPSSSDPQPIPPPPQPVERYYLVADSYPLVTSGLCKACKSLLLLTPSQAFDDDSMQRCPYCGALTARLDAFRLVLAGLNLIAWSLFNCDKYIYDQFTIKPGVVISYMNTPTFEKWLRHDAFLENNPDNRYQGNPIFVDTKTPIAYFHLRDQWPSLSAPEPLPDITSSWYRYGLSSVGAVPAWRQALFGAVTLIPTNPAAAVVLVAAGFEAFFVETTRIGWQEQGLDEIAFGRLDRNSISSLIEWLPAAVRLPSLVDAPGNLHGRWRQIVNQRRNDVVHRADVQVTSEEAQESLQVALEAITYLDPFALTRPHAYFVGR